MKFLIESIGDRTEELENILFQSEIEYINVKFIPFRHTFDLILKEPYSNFFPLASTSTVMLGKSLGMKVFFTEENYTYDAYLKNIGKDFINEDFSKIKFRDLLSLKEERVLIRDFLGNNIIKGKVYEKSPMSGYSIVYDSFLGRTSYGTGEVNDERDITISIPKNIKSEYRFFVVNREIVSGSQYFSNGSLFTKNIDHVDYKKLFDFVNKMIEKFCPDESFVIDIGILDNDELKVIEYNCINCSGFYDINIEKLINKIVKKYT